MVDKRRVYVRIAEAALGHTLPKEAVVHHIDEDRSNNVNTNLVILQDRGEHNRLHRRLRILKAGGDPWHDQICGKCLNVKPLSEFPAVTGNTHGRSAWCYACTSTYVWKRKNPTKTHKETPKERSERNRAMALRRWHRAL